MYNFTVSSQSTVIVMVVVVVIRLLSSVISRIVMVRENSPLTDTTE